MKRFISTTNITLLLDIDKTIDINKSAKAYYFKIFRIELDYLTNFINNLTENEVYLINPLISINCKLSDPYITLSRQFLVTSKSNPHLINDYLLDKFSIARNDFTFEDGNYFLILKYKLVSLDYRYY